MPCIHDISLLVKCPACEAEYNDELATLKRNAASLVKVLEEHFIDTNGHLKTCGGACDPDCQETRAALAELKKGLEA